jgi:hypothetical protein
MRPAQRAADLLQGRFSQFEEVVPLNAWSLVSAQPVKCRDFARIHPAIRRTTMASSAAAALDGVVTFDGNVICLIPGSEGSVQQRVASSPARMERSLANCGYRVAGVMSTRVPLPLTHGTCGAMMMRWTVWASRLVASKHSCDVTMAF